MADSSTNRSSTSTRQSSRIAKRLKTSPSTSSTGTADINSGSCNAVAVQKHKTQKQTATRTKCNITKNPPSLTPTLLCNTSTSTYDFNSSSLLECDIILNEILSYVGDLQYLFIGSVNRSFEKSYVSLYPKKTTHFNASTIGYAKSCWDDICQWKNEEKKEEQKRKLYHSAIQYGNVEVVKYLLKLLPPPQKNVSFRGIRRENRKEIDWKYDLCYKAAKHGQMELLQWACDENICVAKDDWLVCHNAIAHGHIDIFEWAIQNGFPFEDHDMAGFDACRNGQLEALKYLIDNDYEVNVGGGNFGESCGCCNSAAQNGHIDILSWLHDHYETNCDGFVMESAIASGHVPTVKFLLEKDCGWLECDGPCNLAAFVGPLEMLQLLRSYDIEWDEDVIVEKAAEGGHLEIIEWAHENGCPMTESACQYAAGFGHLETLKGLRAMGCPWDEDTTTYALTDEIYNWAKMNGCPVEKGNPREDLESSFGETVIQKCNKWSFGEY